MTAQQIITRLVRFQRREDGVALVEFALFLPVFLLAFFVVVEFGRTFFSYQGALSGVRDATRFAARTMDHTVCEGRGDDFGEVIAEGSAATPDATYQIVERNLLNEVDLLPTNVRIDRTFTSYRCVVQPGDFRNDEIAIATVMARIVIVLPLGGVLEFNGRPLLENITTEIFDESRMYGV